jgi:hypothetical protein
VGEDVSDDVTQALTAEFIEAARRYVAQVDAREGSSPQRFLLALQPLLCELVFRASVLPDVELPDDECEDTGCKWDSDEINKSTDRRLQIYGPLHASLEAFLGEYDLYWKVWDPVELAKDDPMRWGLSDDVAETYCDLREALAQVPPAGQQLPDDVLWDWRFSFSIHWGQHAIDAIRTIYAYVAHHDLGELAEAEGGEEQGV